MTPHLRQAVLFLLLIWAPLAALAKDMRFPEKGAPAYVLALPDDWTSRTDEAGENLIMAHPSRTASLVVLVGETGQPLDAIANDALATASASVYHRKEPAEISGRKGFTYFSTMKNASGTEIVIEVTIVRVDANHIASASLLLWPGLAKADETAARIVKNGLKLVTK